MFQRKTISGGKLIKINVSARNKFQHNLVLKLLLILGGNLILNLQIKSINSIKSAKVQSAKVHFEDILEMVSIAIKIRRLSRADVLTQPTYNKHTVSLTAAQCLCAAAGLLSLGALLGILWARRQERD